MRSDEIRHSMNDVTANGHHCAYCGHRLSEDAPEIERFGEHICSDAHAGEFIAGVRAQRMQAARQRVASAAQTGCDLPPAGQGSWREYLKRGACWGAPLLLLVAIPVFWTGTGFGATAGSLLGVLALFACPLGMYFMMRSMSGMGQHKGDEKHESVTRDMEGRRKDDRA